MKAVSQRLQEMSARANDGYATREDAEFLRKLATLYHYREQAQLVEADVDVSAGS